jgi:hypothetical protein
MPITTEWLNQLVTEINDLKNTSSSSSSSTGAAQKVIDFYGPGLSGNTAVQVQTGIFRTTAPAAQKTIEANVNFPIPFADNNVFIVTTPSFPDPSGRPAKASASVSGVNANSFRMTIMLVTDTETFGTDRAVSVNYIAIGKKKS